MGQQITVSVFPDFRRNFVPEEIQSLPSALRHMVKGGVADRFCPQEAGFHHFRQNLLQMKIGSILPAQHEVGDLGVGQGEFYFFQHIKND